MKTKLNVLLLLLVLLSSHAIALSFAPAVNYAVGYNPISVVAADVNGDGHLDIITGSYNGNTLSVWMNVPTLSLNTSSNGMQVSWPSNWKGWVLQQNADLTTANWTTSPGVSDDGTNKKPHPLVGVWKHVLSPFQSVIEKPIERTGILAA